MWFITWLKARKEVKQDQAYKSGFDWAAGALLREEETPMSIEVTYGYNHESYFDHGVSDAIEALIELKIVEDDRF